jgi:uncharacterized protein YfaS (alpha-2-macroglobulin family)
MPSVSQGFAVAREYLSPSTGEPLSSAAAGDLVQVRVTVMAPATLHDVLVEDPLPAGLEAVDTRLKTTSLAEMSIDAGAKRGWQPWTHVDVRSDRVALFANVVPPGAYQYTYLARATLPGEYRVLPVNGHEQYFPEVFARGDGRRFTVIP